MTTTPSIESLLKSSQEYDSLLQLNGYGSGEDSERVKFTIVVCATDDLEFNTAVKEQFEELVDAIQAADWTLQ